MFAPLLNIYQRFAARRMFSRWSPAYEREVAENFYSAADETAKAAIRYIAGSGIKNPAIADIGIGTGLLAQQLCDAMPCRITGLDFTEDMMAVCAARAITELLIKCDAGRDMWPMQDSSQHFVVSSGLFEYLMPDMAQHFLQQAHRVLQQNGLTIFTYMPCEDAHKITLWRGHSGTYLICGYAPEEMERLVNTHGFKIMEHTSPFKGCIFADGSSYDYRLIAAQKI